MKIAGLAFAVLGLAACGSESSEPSDSTKTAEPTAAPRSEEVPKRSADEAEVARQAQAYMDGLSSGNYEAVCRTRAPLERKELARLAGSCERSFENLVKNKPAISDLFRAATVGEVRIRRAVAGADLRQRGQTEPATTVGAVKLRGRWYLQDLPDRRIP